MSTKREVIPLPVRTPDTASGSGQPVSMAVGAGIFCSCPASRRSICSPASACKDDGERDSSDSN